MSRKHERILLKIMGIWQLLDGLYTTIFYGILPQAGLGSMKLGSNYTGISFILGTLLLILGLANLLVSRRYLQDGQIYKKTGIFILAQALFSYFILDIISLIVGMVAGVILLSKNKSIRLNTRGV